jgi:protein-S-isoprenylcysteine O-methyltransferase Ste14
MNWLKTFVFTLLAPGSVWMLFPYLILHGTGRSAPDHFSVLQGLGILLALLGLSIYVWTASDFVRIGRGTPAPVFPTDRLVVRGLYRYVRNPMYLGVLSWLLGEICFFESLWLLLYTAVVMTVIHTFIVLYEEPTLQRSFGQAYTDYRAHVRRWIPGLKPYREDLV